MKYIKKIIVLFLFISAFLVLSPSIVSKAATLVPKMNLEIPNGATFDANTPMKIRGWALNSSGIKAIDIYVDSTWKKTLVNGDGFGLSRPDVSQAYPSYPNASNSGYEYNLPLSGISNGSHTLTVWAIGNDGTKTNYQITINVSSLPHVYLESLSNDQNVPLNKPIELRGWALNNGSAGADQVDIWTIKDGDKSSEYKKSLSTNLSRPDVAQLYPNYYNNTSCGYDGYISFPANGKYTIYVNAMKGTTRLATYTVTITVGPISKGQEVVNYAKQFLGVPYVWAGTSPSSGFDCSGFTMYVFNHFGITLPHYADSQKSYGSPVSFSQLQPGDLLCFDWDSDGEVDHVGIYVGNNQFIQAHGSQAHPDKVIISDLNSYHINHLVAQRRLV